MKSRSQCLMQDQSRWLRSSKAVWCRLYNNLFPLLPLFSLFLVCYFAHQWSSCLILLRRAELLKVMINFLSLLKFVFDEEGQRFFSALCSILEPYKFQYLSETLISPWIFCDYCLICFFCGFFFVGVWLVCLFRLFGFEVLVLCKNNIRG